MAMNSAKATSLVKYNPPKGLKRESMKKVLY